MKRFLITAALGVFPVSAQAFFDCSRPAPASAGAAYYEECNPPSNPSTSRSSPSIDEQSQPQDVWSSKKLCDTAIENLKNALKISCRYNSCKINMYVIREECPNAGRSNAISWAEEELAKVDQHSQEEERSRQAEADRQAADRAAAIDRQVAEAQVEIDRQTIQECDSTNEAIHNQIEAKRLYLIQSRKDTYSCAEAQHRTQIKQEMSTLSQSRQVCAPSEQNMITSNNNQWQSGAAVMKRWSTAVCQAEASKAEAARKIAAACAADRYLGTDGQCWLKSLLLPKVSAPKAPNNSPAPIPPYISDECIRVGEPKLLMPTDHRTYTYSTRIYASGKKRCPMVPNYSYAPNDKYSYDIGVVLHTDGPPIWRKFVLHLKCKRRE